MPRGGGAGEPDERELGPLPGGHHGLSPEQVAESQRERLLAAVVEVVAAKGFRDATITEIAKTASVANRVFYANFKTKEEAFTAAFDAVADHLAELIGRAAAEFEDWPRQVLAALRATLEFFEAEPALAGFCLLAPFTAPTPIVAHCRSRAAAALPYLGRGRKLQPDGERLPPSTEDSLLGGVVAQISRRIFAGEASLQPLFPDLAEFLLGPYLGAVEVRRLLAEF